MSDKSQANDHIYSELVAHLSEACVLRRNEPMARRTTLRVGGTADFYLEPASENDLAAALQFCAQTSLPFLILGRGSNLLVRDGGIRGLVISLAQPVFSSISVSDAQIHCGAGAKLKNIAGEARKHSLGGLEFLEGIPGSLGGALRMNAGAMGGAIFDVVERVRLMEYSGRVFERGPAEMGAQYRSCPLLRNHIALGAVLRGTPGKAAEIAERMKRFSQKRWEVQPKEPSAGCTFKNPAGVPAGKLIDELGLKGTRVGGAVVSPVHGNFIVNTGNASANDVLNLIQLIAERAKIERNIELETEVEIVGES